MSAYPLHDRALAYAVHCLGVREQPDGSNHGPIQRTHPDGGVDYFEQHDFVPGGGYPWCVTLWLTSWAVGAGHPLPYLSPSAHGQGDWARKNGRAVPVDQLIPGDGCDWSIGSGHLSMFERYDAKTRTVHTVDGNWQNQVQRVAHPLATLRTGIHVPEAKPAPPVPQPFWVIATSHNGHRQLLFTKFATEAFVLNKILPPLIKRYGKAGITITRGGVRQKT